MLSDTDIPPLVLELYPCNYLLDKCAHLLFVILNKAINEVVNAKIVRREKIKLYNKIIL